MSKRNDFSWVQQEFGYKIQVPYIWENLKMNENKGFDGLVTSFIHLFDNYKDCKSLVELVVALTLNNLHYECVDDELAQVYKQLSKIGDEVVYNSLKDDENTLGYYIATIGGLYPFDEMHEYR